MKIKVSEATPLQLDWLVAKIEGLDTRNNACVWFLPFQAESDDLLQFICMADDEAHAQEQCEDAYPDCTVDRVDHIAAFSPTTDWSQGGPIIERENISSSRNLSNVEVSPNVFHLTSTSWLAQLDYSVLLMSYSHSATGPTLLTAAMRCFVASKLGDEVDVPDELK